MSVTVFVGMGGLGGLLPPVLRPYYDLLVVTSMCSILWLFLPGIAPPCYLSIGVDNSSTLLCWPGFFRPPPSQRRISPTSIEGGMESPLQLLFPGLRSIWRSFLHACPCSLLVPSLARSCFSFPGQCKYGSWDGVSSLHLRVNGKSSSTLP